MRWMKDMMIARLLNQFRHVVPQIGVYQGMVIRHMY